MQNKADSDEDGDPETVIGKNPPEYKNILCIFCDGSAKSTRDEKWIECTECLVWTHIKCLDIQT